MSKFKFNYESKRFSNGDFICAVCGERVAACWQTHLYDVVYDDVGNRIELGDAIVERDCEVSLDDGSGLYWSVADAARDRYAGITAFATNKEEYKKAIEAFSGTPVYSYLKEWSVDA